MLAGSQKHPAGRCLASGNPIERRKIPLLRFIPRFLAYRGMKDVSFILALEQPSFHGASCRRFQSSLFPIPSDGGERVGGRKDGVLLA